MTCRAAAAFAQFAGSPDRRQFLLEWPGRDGHTVLVHDSLRQRLDLCEKCTSFEPASQRYGSYTVHTVSFTQVVSPSSIRFIFNKQFAICYLSAFVDFTLQKEQLAKSVVQNLMVCLEQKSQERIICKNDKTKKWTGCLQESIIE